MWLFGFTLLTSTNPVLGLATYLILTLSPTFMPKKPVSALPVYTNQIQSTPTPATTQQPAINGKPIKPTTATTPTPTPLPAAKQTATPAPTTPASNTNQGTAAPTNAPTASATATPTPVPLGATVSTRNVTITMNRGETKSNVFSFTSTGANGFTLYGYPTTYGPGINWNPSSGGMSVGNTMQASLSVNANVPVGTYTGTGRIQFTPSNAETTIAFSVTVQDAPQSAMGFTFSADSVNVTAQKNGAPVNVFTFTSTGSTAFSFYGYPTSYGPGINWGVSSGGVGTGQTNQQTIQVVNVAPGTYAGTGQFRDDTTGAQKNIPVTVTVTE